MQFFGWLFGSRSQNQNTDVDIEVAKQALQQEVEEQNRIRKENYLEYWRLYNGDHWHEEEEDTEFPTPTFNKVYLFVNKALAFLIGKPATVNYIATEQEPLLAPFVQSIISNSGGMSLFTYSAAQMGSVTGDLFIKIIWDAEIRGVRFQVLDSSDVDVKYTFLDYDNNIPDECRITWKFLDSDGLIRLITETWTSYSVITEIDGEVREDRSGPNILGIVPVVHVRNHLIGKSVYGLSDVKQLENLNKLLNSSIRRFMDNVHMNADPILVVKGARLKSVEKGVGKVWGNLPVNSDVGYVGKDLEFPALQKMVEYMDDALYAVGGIPKASLTGDMSISNTSGTAMYMMLLPIIELTDRKKLTYGPGFAQAISLALELLYKVEKRNKAIEDLGPEFWQATGMYPMWGYEYSGILDVPEKVTEVLRNHKEPSVRFRKWNEVTFEFGEYLPKDQLVQRQLIREELAMGLESRKNAMKRLGKDNIDELIKEINDDMEYYKTFFGGKAGSANTIPDHTEGVRNVTETAKGAAKQIKSGGAQ